VFDDLLVVGWDLANSARVHVDDMPLDHWRAKGFSGDSTLVCMYCLQEGRTVSLVVKGKVLGARRAHFAHPAGAAHETGHGPETAWHANGKWAVAEMAQHHPEVETALIEWPTPDKTRRADVRVLMRDGSKLAFELQYRPLSDPDFTARCDDYQRNNITSVWLWRPGLARPGIMLQHGQPIWWLHVEARQITGLFGRPHPRPHGWHNHEDIARYALHWPPCPDDQLTQHTWPLADTILDSRGLRPPAAISNLIHQQHQQLRDQAARLAKAARNAAARPKAAARRGLPHQPDPSADPYVEPPTRQQEEPRQLQEQLRRQRDDQQDIKLEQQRQQQEQGSHAANKMALLNRQRLLTPTVVHEIAEKTGVTPWSMDEGDFELAMGVSIIANSKTVAVICPVASRITPEVADRLLAITIYVASEQERRNIARHCRPDQRIIVMPTASR